MLCVNASMRTAMRRAQSIEGFLFTTNSQSASLILHRHPCTMSSFSNRHFASQALTLRVPSSASSISSPSYTDTLDSARWTLRSSSLRSVIPDLGMISGKLFYALGKAEIGAMKTLWVPYRRRQIRRALCHPDSIAAKDLSRMYDDLLDFIKQAFIFSVSFPCMTLTSPLETTRMRAA
jgi:hypothetical protein